MARKLTVGLIQNGATAHVFKMVSVPPSRNAMGGPLATRLLDAVERSAAGLGRTRP